MTEEKICQRAAGGWGEGLTLAGAVQEGLSEEVTSELRPE